MSLEKQSFDPLAIIDGYIAFDNSLNRENSNFVRHVARLEGALSSEACKRYWFDRVFGPEVEFYTRTGAMYLHDCGKLAPYCCGFSARDIAVNGLKSNCGNLLHTRPPKYLSSLMGQMYNFIVLISQEVAGAVALNDATTIVASYLWYEEEKLANYIDPKRLENEWESFIYNVGLPLRAGGQSPFSNLLLEFGGADPHLRDEYVVIGGEVMDIKYGDIPQEYFDRVNVSFIDAMAKKDPDGKPLTFPLITVNLYDDFDWDNPAFAYLLQKMYAWGGVYFESFLTKPFEDEKWKAINPLIKPRDPSSQRSFCCRFQVSFEDILKASGGNPFRSQSGTGGVGVVNLNMNRVFMLHGNDYDAVLEATFALMDVANDVLMARRRFIEEHRDLYPMFFWYNKSLDSFFNVISMTGFHEGLINAGFDGGLANEEGKTFVHNLLQDVSVKMQSMMAAYKVPIGLEAAPSESAACVFAKKDLQWAASQGRPAPFVQGDPSTGLVWLTSGAMAPFQEANLSLQHRIASEFQTYFTSGSVMHVFLNEFLDPSRLKHFIKRIFSSPVIYATITPTITGCGSCGSQFVGEFDLCPSCSSDDVFVASRVIGYVKPISRKNLRLKGSALEGDYNFWRDERRADWVSRNKFEGSDLDSFRVQDLGLVDS